jgi:hypothetical protein
MPQSKCVYIVLKDLYAKNAQQALAVLSRGWHLTVHVSAVSSEEVYRLLQ